MNLIVFCPETAKIQSGDVPTREADMLENVGETLAVLMFIMALFALVQPRTGI